MGAVASGQAGPEPEGQEQRTSEPGWWDVCYTLAGREVKAEETFRQLDEALKWQALVLVWDLNQPKIH